MDKQMTQKSRIIEQGALFDQCPRPFGVVEVVLDESGKPVDIVYLYLNEALAAITDSTVEELQGKAIYELWPGDEIWLRYFYLAAYEQESHEFEAVSEMLKQFFHMTTFPISPGYCGFIINDVKNWVQHAYETMSNASTGLFIYDARNRKLMLTPSAQKHCRLDISYMAIDEFADILFGAAGEGLKQQAAQLKHPGDQLHFEEQLSDGRWMRIIVGLPSNGELFAYGFLEDITRSKEAEIINDRYMEIVDSISRENFVLILADLDKDMITPYRIRDKRFDLRPLSPQGLSYSEFLPKYIDQYVVDSDKELVSRELNVDVLSQKLDAGEDDVSIIYQHVFDDIPQFIELRLFRLSPDSKRLVMAGRDINSEMQDQIQQTEALQTALDLAQHASKAKSTFLTNMSHDFRTPMNSIMGFANIALDNIDDKDRVEDSLKKILLSSNHLISLINDILDVSRIESGRIELAEESVSIADIAQNLESVFAGEAAQRSIDFSVQVTDVKKDEVKADVLRLNQILVNTVGNAMKFTRRGGSVDVSIRQLDKSLPNASQEYNFYEFVISDTGCGMSPEFVEKLFLPFERDSRDFITKTEGTGLGMTITKNLVDLMGGNIKVKTALNEGTTFYITLPLRPSSTIGTFTSADKNKVHHHDDRKFDGKTLLVVDDDELSREIACHLLREHGFFVEEACDGDIAVERFTSSDPHHFDAIVMDMRMPRMNGDEACRVIRDLDRDDATSVPIIAATADAFAESYDRSRDAGMTAHVTKPLNIHELLDVLEESIANK